jgi:hypothetical protein
MCGPNAELSERYIELLRLRIGDLMPNPDEDAAIRRLLIAAG